MPGTWPNHDAMWSFEECSTLDVPLVITEEELNQGLDILENAIRDVNPT